MFKRIRKIEGDGFKRVWRRGPEGRLERWGWRFGWITLVGVGIGVVLPGDLGRFFFGLAWLCGIPMAWCVWWLLVGWVLRRVLWTVTSRLVVTCLLMGLAPIVLFGMLGGISAYLFGGQFATSVALEGIKDESLAILDRSRGVLAGLSHGHAAEVERVEDGFALGWRDGRPIEPIEQTASAMFGDALLPEWVQPGFHGVVAQQGRLYVCGVSGEPYGGHILTAMACSPFRKREVTALAEGLGEISVSPNLADQTMTGRLKGKASVKHGVAADAPERYAWVQGGAIPTGENLLDLRVYFSAPLKTRTWETGEELPTFLNVVSRPSMLYQRLFATSVNAGTYVYAGLIGAAVFFGVLELLAVALALLVSRTIAVSVRDLYAGTKAIDKGDFEHRVPVRRKDQLSALAASFNGMAASLKTLLEEQREKQRMESELHVAQEVQRNLFPHTSFELPELDVFGVCEPARTIGGDYYDFIPFGGSQVYLSLGDISGKGISAALLMASLHSAVRAYRAVEGSGEATETVSVEESLSPGRLLGLLNKHLLTSTQPAKYATLFLASYDAATRRLTYANGGHPPPVLLRADGSLRRLECGGSVVGLLDGLVYAEETVQLLHGDLLVAYSDGLSEPEKGGDDSGEEFGEDRLVEVVRRNSILSLPEVAAHTLTAVREWIGDAEQPDDMTLVLMRVG
jgi:sigma-B regulation protein RsbU (phosphoserine phosphatase)